MVKELNILRIVFMMMIFLNHSAFLTDGGYLGVACFFVLGGYCSTLGYYRKVLSEDFSYGRYAFSKASKYYPLHWLCAAAWLVLAVISSQPVGTAPQMLSNVFLLHSWIPDIGYYFSINGISWYLADTLFFALVFPFVVRHIVSKSLSRNIVFVLLVLSAYVAVCILTPVDRRHAILYIHPTVRFVDFLLGVYLAKAIMAFKKKLQPDPKKMLAMYLMLVLCIAALLVERRLAADYVQFAWIFWPLISVLLLCASLASEYRPKDSKLIDILSQVGSYVFVFYMTHQMVIQVCNSLAHKLHFEYHFAVMVITLAIGCCVAFLCQKWFVEPVTKAIGKRIALSSK